MTAQQNNPPPPELSPLLLLQRPLSTLPAPWVDRALAMALGITRQRHPAVFERLAAGVDIVPPARPCLLITADDLPWPLFLDLDPHHPALRIAGPDDMALAMARISGPLALLLDLLQGRSDGDAAFFAGRLRIEGDTSLMVALRNAVDDAEIDLLADIRASCGRLGHIAMRPIALGLRLHAAASRDMARVAQAITGPGDARADAGLRRLAAIDGRLGVLERQTARRRPHKPDVEPDQ